MNLSDMQVHLRFLVDDVVESKTAVILLNAGQNRMAVESKCNFPQLNELNADGTFVFPEKYHEMPVLYAAAMFKSYDSSVRESDSFMSKFLNALPEFVENYTPPYRYRDDYNIRQYIVEDSNKRTYSIPDDGYNPDSAELKVYIDDIRTDVALEGKSFTIPDGVALTSGTHITAIWEIHPEMNKAPFSWWEGLP